MQSLHSIDTISLWNSMIHKQVQEKLGQDYMSRELSEEDLEVLYTIMIASSAKQVHIEDRQFTDWYIYMRSVDTIGDYTNPQTVAAKQIQSYVTAQCIKGI